MSCHIGVSCDACLKTNFPTRRYKCLTCDNYDLCGPCHDVHAESHNHRHTHPMQCLLTKTAYELFYTGELVSHRTVLSLTCPYCGLAGFVCRTLLIHCLDKHSIVNDSNELVMCPICVVGHQARFVSLADHIVREHDEGGDLAMIQMEKKDNPDDDEGEGSPLYLLAEQLFLKEEQRRQTVGSQRRPLTMRTSRGNHLNNYPYGTLPRTITGSFRLSEPYATGLFSQEYFIECNPSAAETTHAPFFLRMDKPMQIPSVKLASNDRKKSILSETQQKHSTESSVADDRTLEMNTKNDSQSLLERLLKTDLTGEHHNQDTHISFLHALLLSSIENISPSR